MKTRFAVLTLLSAPALASAAVVPINLSDFANPTVLDFQSAPVGTTSGTASLFTDFGISSVSATGFSFTDIFNVRPNSSRALWINSSGLAIVGPGTTTLAELGVSYTIKFQADRARFGIGVHDQANELFSLSFFDNNALVGTSSFTSDGSADLNMAFFESTAPFDRVTIASTTLTAAGFAIDNITVETVAAAVPEPGSAALLCVALGAFGVSRGRKKS
jgi:hypothetical protein